MKTACADETCRIIRQKSFEESGVRLPTISRVTAYHVTRHNISSQGEVLPEKFSCFIGDLEDPETKQNIPFQALKPFIPPENHELYAESLTEDITKACDSQEGESNPQKKAKKKNRKSCPCPLPPVTRLSSDSPQPPSMHTSSPLTAVKCMRDRSRPHRGRSLQSKISLPCVHIPRWGIPDNAPVWRSVSKWGIQRILQSHVSKG